MKKKVPFFDNIFYWLWLGTPLKGFPDRSFAVITFFQFAYIVFAISLLLSILGDETILRLYENPTPFFLPLFLVLIVLLVFNLKKFTEKKYNDLVKFYKQMSNIEKRRYRDRFVVFSAITITVIITDAILLVIYYNHLMEVVINNK